MSGGGGTGPDYEGMDAPMKGEDSNCAGEISIEFYKFF